MIRANNGLALMEKNYGWVVKRGTLLNGGAASESRTQGSLRRDDEKEEDDPDH